MAKFYNQGSYKPVNPQKYVGTYPLTYRSAWELTVMNMFDKHPNVTQWASESLQVPYQHPFTGRWTVYIPDFFVLYTDKDGKQHGELIEVKPINQTFAENAKGQHNKREYIINQAKWKAALAWCAKHGLTFRVLTEQDLYRNARKKR